MSIKNLTDEVEIYRETSPIKLDIEIRKSRLIYTPIRTEHNGVSYNHEGQPVAYNPNRNRKLRMSKRQ